MPSETENAKIAERFGFGRGHNFRDHDQSEIATLCTRCGREGLELEQDCSAPRAPAALFG